MHSRTIASQRAINDRWRSAGWESLILPGHTATGGEGGSESRPRGRLRSGAPASPSGESGFAPPSDFSFSAGFLFPEKKECKEQVDDGTNNYVKQKSRSSDVCEERGFTTKTRFGDCRSGFLLCLIIRRASPAIRPNTFPLRSADFDIDTSDLLRYNVTEIKNKTHNHGSVSGGKS